MRKVFSGPSVGECSRPPRPALVETPCKEKPLSEVKTLLPQQPEKELIAETSGAVPLAEFVASTPLDPTPTSVPAPGSKKKGSASTEPSPWKGKKKKEPSPEEEELEEDEETGGEMGSSTEGSGSGEATPSLEARRVNTRSSKRKRAYSELRTLAVSKKQHKSPGKGGSSQKKIQTK